MSIIQPELQANAFSRSQSPVLFLRIPTTALTGLTGGGALNLDGIDVANLSVGQPLLVYIAGVAYNYVLTTSGAAENSPTVIQPDTGNSAVRWILQTGPAAGADVVGPASATDDAVVRFDGTTGKLLQNSSWTISDAGAATGTSLALSGTTSVLNVSASITDTNNADGVILNTVTSATANGAFDMYGLSSQMTSTLIPTGVYDTAGRTAITGDGYVNNASFRGRIGRLVGLRGRAGFASAGAGAVADNVYAGQFEIRNEDADATITNGIGVYIINNAATGTMTNRWDLYAGSTNAKNYFAGVVGIGVSNPTLALEVVGQGKFSSGLVLTTGSGIEQSGATTGSVLNSVTNTGGTSYFGVDDSNGGTFTGTTAYATVVGTGANLDVQIVANAGVVATFNSTKTTLAGAYVGSTQPLSGAGAANVTTETTKITTTGVGNAITLADGVDGQTKIILHDVDGGSFVLTPTTKTGWSTFTSTAAGESITLKFVTTRGWIVTGSYLGVIAP